MQVANALNNVIRILFNPKIEAFKLFDFLVVKSNDVRYLAQITEIYDDKFDASQNVAKLKIFYKISQNNEVMPYDNFTPSKECEIIKIKQEEVEDFINLDKETFIFATNAKSSTSLSLQYAFFENNPLVLADKLESASTISLNIAKKLSARRPSVFIDSTGVVDHECAKKITASKDIKIPLNFSTIDYVFDRCLKNATLEFQASAGAIINEIKNFARKQPSEFIPFNAFLRVILEQYKATPYPELKLLLVKMKKFQMSEIFARYKKDVENLTKTIEKNPVTVIDISNVDSYWQKVYIEYITDSLEIETNLITRINDENCGVDLINKIYNKKKNINFIPTVSYNYKKLPTLLQFSKNYILLPSLNQRPDFLDANFALSNLITNECIIFGENTDNFLYLAKDYELEEQEKRKNYKKIALTLVSRDEEEAAIKQNLGENGDYFENQQKTDSQKLLSELADFDEENQKKINAAVSQDDEEFTEIENPKVEEQPAQEFSFEEEQNIEEASSTQEELNFEEHFEEEKSEEEQEDSNNDDFSLEDFASNIEESDSFEFQKEEETPKEEPQEEVQEQERKEPISNTQEALLFADEEELVFTETNESETPAENKEETPASKEDDNLDDLVFANDNSSEINLQEDKENLLLDESETIQEENEEDLNFSDEELDFFQIAKESQEENQPKTQESENEEIDLSEISENSLDVSFENIINSEANETSPEIEIDENTKINEDVLLKEEQNNELPIFKDETIPQAKEENFEVNDRIVHPKFGKGTVIETKNISGKTFLRIEFDEKDSDSDAPNIKMLDPIIGGLVKIEQ